MPKINIILLLIINLIIAYLFITFALAYINEIDPNLNHKNKSVFLFLVYIILFINIFMFINSLLSIGSLFIC